MAVKGFGVPDLVIRISVLVVLSALSVLLSGNVLVPINLVALIFDLINTGTGDHLQVVKSPVTAVNSISALLFVAIWHVGRDLHVQRWVLRHQQFLGWGQFLVWSIDQESAQVLEAVDHQPYFGLGRVTHPQPKADTRSCLPCFLALLQFLISRQLVLAGVDMTRCTAPVQSCDF